MEGNQVNSKKEDSYKMSDLIKELTTYIDKRIDFRLFKV